MCRIYFSLFIGIWGQVDMEAWCLETAGREGTRELPAHGDASLQAEDIQNHRSPVGALGAAACASAILPVNLTRGKHSSASQPHFK